MVPVVESNCLLINVLNELKIFENFNKKISRYTYIGWPVSVRLLPKCSHPCHHVPRCEQAYPRLDLLNLNFRSVSGSDSYEIVSLSVLCVRVRTWCGASGSGAGSDGCCFRGVLRSGLCPGSSIGKQIWRTHLSPGLITFRQSSEGYAGNLSGNELA